MAAVAQVRLRAGDGVDVLEHAKALGLEAYGVSFHVGSQQTKVDAWDRALGDAKRSSRRWPSAASAEDGQHGRRFPDQVPQGRAGPPGLWPGDLSDTLRKHFGNQHPGDHHRAGSRHGRQCRRHQDGSRADLEEGDDNDNVRWVYLDIGKFGGLAETMDEAIRYPIRTPRDGAMVARACSPARPAIRPTCSTRRTPYPLPLSLTIGDEVLIEGTGAYTTTYSAVAFNGFEPLRSYVI
jgi:ornithine decarboxylase